MDLWRVTNMVMFFWICEGKPWKAFQPVCGEDGTTYTSGCLAKYFGVKVDCYGGCPCGSCVCQEVYQPVCGEDGKTYANRCNAECANMEVVHEGTCEGCICIAIYNPVCGKDGKTYSNSCEAGCVNMEVECEGSCPCP